MVFPIRHIRKIKNLVVALLLGLFLVSNYGVNFTHYHSHEKQQQLADSDKEVKDCLICAFQGMLYEPLVQNNFKIDEFVKYQEVFINSLLVLNFSSEHYLFTYQRGPPAHLVL